MHRFLRLLLVPFFVLTSLPLLAKDLRVGISPDMPPLAYLEQGKLTGIETAAAESLGKLMGKDVDFVQLPFAELVPALQAGKIDIIMSGMSITAERSKHVSFTNSYMDAGQMAIIRFADAGQFAFRGAIFRPGSKVAVEQQTTGEAFADQHLRQATLSRCSSVQEALNKLKSREVDFVVHDASTSWSLASNRDTQDLMSINHAMTDETLGWAVAKNNPELLSAVNRHLKEMQDRGILRAIINKWIPVTVQVENQR